MKPRSRFLAWLAAIAVAFILLFLFSLLEVTLFKPYELGAALGTLFVYGRLAVMIFVGRFVYKKVRYPKIKSEETEVKTAAMSLSALDRAIDNCDDNQ